MKPIALAIFAGIIALVILALCASIDPLATLVGAALGIALLVPIVWIMRRRHAS